MRGHPLSAAPEHRAISTAVPNKPRPESSVPVRTSSSRCTKPKVLMGEVTAPIQKYAASSGGGEHYGQQRYLLRSFMQARGLRPSDWARSAGVAPGELLGFLTGRARTIPPASLQKLADAAGCKIEDMLQ
ncbi:MAG: helix-turn-helix transcriptional regulator [Alphaproteobacteria bacterium]|nr:helix-turn-helix transcriptional regulator [Alphaproteobacteria bacterium]